MWIEVYWLEGAPIAEIVEVPPGAGGAMRISAGEEAIVVIGGVVPGESVLVNPVTLQGGRRP